jgi:hypothetical protein
MKNAPRIQVLQYMHGDFEYFHWSEKINRAYCTRHGYQHVISRETPRSDRHITWHKIPVIVQAIKNGNADYLLFLDADAVFYSHELTIENELLPLLNDKGILMSQDFGSERDRWTPGLPNAGVILIKADHKTCEFFEFWDQASDMDESTRWNWPPEQLALWRMVLPKYPDMVHVHAEYYMLHGRYGQYIRHYYASSDHVRTTEMQSVSQRVLS